MNRFIHRRSALHAGLAWGTSLLLLPTMVLLGLFIAYPFIKGIMLSVTNARVGC